MAKDLLNCPRTSRDLAAAVLTIPDQAQRRGGGSTQRQPMIGDRVEPLEIGFPGTADRPPPTSEPRSAARRPPRPARRDRPRARRRRPAEDLGVSRGSGVVWSRA
jgi:hypothetical protein